MSEQWRPVVGYEGIYEVSDHGRVRSLDRLVPRGSRPFRLKGRLLAQSTMRSGHKRVALCKNGKGRHHLVHRLVLEAFDRPCPEGMEACHGIGGPGDNRLENIRWGTASDNMKDRVRHNTHHQANKSHCAQGHEYTEENTYIPPTGGRSCRTCRRNSSNAYWQRNRPDPIEA